MVDAGTRLLSILAEIKTLSFERSLMQIPIEAFFKSGSLIKLLISSLKELKLVLSVCEYDRKLINRQMRKKLRCFILADKYKSKVV
jgi:hypothetical protein